jgi:hypothetical protein
MEGLLFADEEQTDQTEKAPADGEGVAAEAKSQETVADEQEATDEVEATETDDQTETQDDQRPQMVTVTIDGKAETIPLEEALKGYQRHSDYTRKTASLANDRQQLVEQTKAVSDERQTYATMLVALRDQLQAMQPEEPDWSEVYKSDPVGYARRRDEWRDKQEKIAAAQFELQRLQSLQQKEQAENLAKTVQQGRAKMLELHPPWKDQKVWEEDRQRLVSYARDVAGYSTEEISQAYDPRAILLLHKARLYDELMAQKPKPVVAKGPKVASAGAAQTGSSKLNAAQQRLAKSGRMEDAARVFEQLI